MEERLLKIIQEGKGEIKDLLQAEKELGEWRTKIEGLEGEIRYYSNLVALSTLTLTLYEKEIRSPSAILELERIQMGLESEDVENAYKEALAAIAEAKGRVTKPELKQHAAGQFTAVVEFEVAPDAAGPLRDRLKQLGTVSRLEINLVREAEGGSGKPQGTTVKRKDSQFFLALYNLANIAPRETTVLHLACTNAEEAFKTILSRIEKGGGRVIQSNLNRQKNDQTTGLIQFEIRSSEAEAILLDLRAVGEVMNLQLLENPDAQNVTKSKRGFQCQIFALGGVAPRETVSMQIAAKDVAESYRLLREAVQKTNGRVLSAQLNESDRHNAVAALDFEIPRDQEKAFLAVLGTAGEVVSRSSSRAQEGNNVVDSKIRLTLSVMDVTKIPPRETLTLGVEVQDVDRVMTELRQLADQFKGRVVESHLTRERSGRIVGRIVLDVPLLSGGGAADRVAAMGTVRMAESSKDSSVPDGSFSVARLNLTISNSDLIVPNDKGFWVQIKRGLSTSFFAASWSLNFIVIGACFILPWALIGWGSWKIYRRVRRKTAPVV
jgi:glycine cleavage system regulatory protein